MKKRHKVGSGFGKGPKPAYCIRADYVHLRVR